MAKTKKQRDYDKERYAEASRKLRTGIEAMRRTKEYGNGKPITAYALSKYTKVSITTVKKHQEILDLLSQTNFPEVCLRSAKVNTDRIHTLEQAIGVIKQMEVLYNDLTVKYNAAMKANSSLNLEVVKFQDEVAELNRVLRKREE